MSPKQIIEIEATKCVEDGMIVGLGTDSTAKFMIDEIGCCVKEEELPIAGVTTSEEIEKQALALGIPLKSVDEVPYIDPTIDGANRISTDFQGIEGGGAALLFGKTVATYSKKCIWIVDRSEMVGDLGAFPLPVEVVPYGSCQLVHLFKEKDYHPAPRLNAAGETLIIDGDHHIIDLHLEKITDPGALDSYLGNLVDAVEHGLFLNIVSMVIVGYEDGPKALYIPAH